MDLPHDPAVFGTTNHKAGQTMYLYPRQIWRRYWFKSNHFLGYTVALNRLDGVYYVDPRPEMRVNERLREQIHDFQRFLVRDLWTLSK